LSTMKQRDFGIRVGVQNLGCNLNSHGACFPEDKILEDASHILERQPSKLTATDHHHSILSILDSLHLPLHIG
jgi:hypothetical protein